MLDANSRTGTLTEFCDDSPSSAAIPIPLAATSGTLSVTTSAPAPIAESIAPAATTSIAAPAIAPLTARLPMFCLDLAATEFGRGDGQPQVGVIGRQFSPLRSLVTPALKYTAADLDRPV